MEELKGMMKGLMEELKDLRRENQEEMKELNNLDEMLKQQNEALNTEIVHLKSRVEQLEFLAKELKEWKKKR